MLFIANHGLGKSFHIYGMTNNIRCFYNKIISRVYHEIIKYLLVAQQRRKRNVTTRIYLAYNSLYSQWRKVAIIKTVRNNDVSYIHVECSGSSDIYNNIRLIFIQSLNQKVRRTSLTYFCYYHFYVIRLRQTNFFFRQRNRKQSFLHRLVSNL